MIDSPARTVAFAAAVALGCSLLVSIAVSVFRPYQLAYESLDRNRAVLLAAGLLEQDAQIQSRELVGRFLSLDVRFVDLMSGAAVSDLSAADFDIEAAHSDAALSFGLPSEIDTAGIGSLPRYIPIYRVPSNQRIVLPMIAQGMWSTIFYYLSLEPDLNTIAGIAIYKHGETPGIGDRIENPQWLAGWRGKRIRNEAGAIAIRIGAPDGMVEEPYRIDAITGATVTVGGLDDSLRFWLGATAYGNLLAEIFGEE
jgi:Na+-transporting NADH:ubiquinone oxidoreductase subunit C